MKPKRAKKKSKEQLEEERVARELEEQRIAEEEQAIAKANQLRLEEEAHERFLQAAVRRAAELVALQAEFETFSPELATREASYQKLQRRCSEALEWKNYIACDLRPKVTDESAMSAYLHLWNNNEDPEEGTVGVTVPDMVDPTTLLQSILDDSTDALAVIQECEHVVTVARAEGQISSDQTYRFITDLKDQMHRKRTRAISQVLSSGDQASANPDQLVAVACQLTKLGLWINGAPKGSRQKKIQFDDSLLEIPKALAGTPHALLYVQVPYEDFLRHAPDCPEVALGGFISLELLQLPPPTTYVKGWTLRTVQVGSMTTLKKLVYPPEGSTTVAPIKLSLTLNPKVLYNVGHPVELGWWDTTSRSWKKEGLEEIDLDPASHRLSFTTTKVAPLALLQPRNVHFTHASWHLAVDMTDDDAASQTGRFTRRSAAFPNLTIEIRPKGVRLLSPSLPAFSHLHEAIVSPGVLVAHLAAAGVNIAPTTEEDRIFSAPCVKALNLEASMIAQIASNCAAFVFSSVETPEVLPLAWKHQAQSSTTAIFQLQPLAPTSILTSLSKDELTPEIDPLDALLIRPVRHVLAQVDLEAPGNQTTFKLVPEKQTSDDEDIYEEASVAHVFLKPTLAALTTPEMKDRCDKSNVEFEKTLGHLLTLLRPFSYCHMTEEVVKTNGEVEEQEQEQEHEHEKEDQLENGHD